MADGRKNKWMDIPLILSLKYNGIEELQFQFKTLNNLKLVN